MISYEGRKSRQKEAVLRVLKSTTSHPAAEWIYGQVKQEIPNISLGTVYRNLRILKEEGRTLEIELADAVSRFDGNPENHYHFRCEGCGRVFDVDMPVDKLLDAKVASDTGFKITHHCLEFRGLCVDCQ